MILLQSQNSRESRQTEVTLYPKQVRILRGNTRGDQECRTGTGGTRVYHVLKPLSCEVWVKVLFRRQLYSVLLQVWKSLHKVCGTPLHPPSWFPTNPARWTGGWWKKKFLSFSKKILKAGVNYSVTRGFRRG